MTPKNRSQIFINTDHIFTLINIKFESSKARSLVHKSLRLQVCAVKPHYMAKPLYMAAYPKYNAFFVRLECTRLHGGPRYMAAKALGQTPAI